MSNSRVNRGNGSSRFLPPAFDQKWGDIVSPGGVGRRCHITNIPRNTTIEDMRNFFGMDKVEGVRINLNKSFAQVQFTKPIFLTDATANSPVEFLGRKLRIFRYEDQSTRARQYPDWSNEDSPTEFKRRLEQTKQLLQPAQRSRSNSSVSSLEEGTVGYANGQVDASIDQEGSRSILEDAIDKFESDRKRKSNQVVPYSQRPSLWIDDRPTIPGEAFSESTTMPADVYFTMQLILNQKSASSCSVKQLNAIIDWLNWEKQKIEKELSTEMFQSKVQANPFQPQNQPQVPYVPQPSQPSTSSQFKPYGGFGRPTPFESLVTPDSGSGIQNLLKPNEPPPFRLQVPQTSVSTPSIEPQINKEPPQNPRDHVLKSSDLGGAIAAVRALTALNKKDK